MCEYDPLRTYDMEQLQYDVSLQMKRKRGRPRKNTTIASVNTREPQGLGKTYRSTLIIRRKPQEIDQDEFRQSNTIHGSPMTDTTLDGNPTLDPRPVFPIQREHQSVLRVSPDLKGNFSNLRGADRICYILLQKRRVYSDLKAGSETTMTSEEEIDDITDIEDGLISSEPSNTEKLEQCLTDNEETDDNLLVPRRSQKRSNIRDDLDISQDTVQPENADETSRRTLLRECNEAAVSIFDKLHWAIVYAKSEEGREYDWTQDDGDIQEAARRYKNFFPMTFMPVIPPSGWPTY